MSQMITLPKTGQEDQSVTVSSETHATQQPVQDITAFLSGFPKFSNEEVEALEKAIAEDRAQRRSAQTP